MNKYIALLLTFFITQTIFCAFPPSKEESSPLYQAVQNNDLKAVCTALAANADVNERVGKWKTTPLILATIQSEEPIVRRLLEAGADPRYSLSSGITALHNVQTASIASLLINFGAPVNACDNGGWTPRMHVLKSSL